jgi:hypothetical protein
MPDADFLAEVEGAVFGDELEHAVVIVATAINRASGIRFIADSSRYSPRAPSYRYTPLWPRLMFPGCGK